MRFPSLRIYGNVLLTVIFFVIKRLLQTFKQFFIRACNYKNTSCVNFLKDMRQHDAKEGEILEKKNKIYEDCVINCH